MALRFIDQYFQVGLNNDGKEIEITKLSPYRMGGYKYEFFLHDSLQLKLDKSYSITLKLTDRKEYIKGFFKYEDYELTKNNLSIRIDKKEQYNGDNIKIFAKGTDENDLNILDGRIEVLVKSKAVNNYHERQVFIPDTLLFLKRNLDQVADETEITISDSTFPHANFDYSVEVTLLTSDNESITKIKDVKYFHKTEKFNIGLEKDSILFQYLKNGKSETKEVTISSKDNYDNKSTVLVGLTPCKIKLNSYYASYEIKSDSISETISIAEEPSLLECFSERTKDSINFTVSNPRNIPFIYNIYKKNVQKTSGYADSLIYKKKLNTNQNYFISLRYLWGSQVKEENYKIPLIDKKLNISVLQPKIVYPGQKSMIEIAVTDIEGKPVEGVDLTAYSLTKKFDYNAPQLPYLGKNKKGKSLINNFHLKDVYNQGRAELGLDYNSWKLFAGLDSIEYYRFIYPGDNIYRFQYQMEDSITQFSPFVVSNGNITPVHVIYVDRKPVYFSWSTNTQPYSFKIDSGYHHIKLRTSDREIEIEKLYFEEGKKLIFSINKNAINDITFISKAKTNLSDHEKRLLYKYIVPYRNNFGERFAYIQNYETIQLLNPQYNYQINNLAGPMVGSINFHLVDSFSTNFYHEPDFEYEFLPKILKMRNMAPYKYPENLFSYNPANRLTDNVLIKDEIEKRWSVLLNNKRYQTVRYSYPNYTPNGSGRLLINICKEPKANRDLPLNILVFKYDDHKFLRVYPGSINLMHDLREGYYKIITFYSGARYQVEDSVYIHPNGINYYEYCHSNTFKKDTFSLYVSNLIEKTIFTPVKYGKDESKEINKIYQTYQQEYKYTGEGNMLEGYVLDAEEGMSLPGVNVFVKGTTYGTVTDLNGYYSLKIPDGKNSLIFSYIGYLTEERNIEHNNILNVNLIADMMGLDEVVVIGYGTQKVSMLTGAISTVTVTNVLGSLPGVNSSIVQSLQGKVAGVDISTNNELNGRGVQIMIRGAKSPESFKNEPLFIINGNVYNGDIKDLDPSLIQNIEILRDENAIAIYGARAANGVVIIETQRGAFKTLKKDIAKAKEGDINEMFLDASNHSNSIRDNFSDYAFWQPDLITDNEGKASFEVVFPDDVTSWETFYLAMNGNRQSGQLSNIIKSYKPLMAQLVTPRFLVKGDTAIAIGKVLNYSSDSILIETRYEVNGINKMHKNGYCYKSIIDSLYLTTKEDSLSVTYSLKTEESYIDGEKRFVPVFSKGMTATKGEFMVLDKDTTIQLKFDSKYGEVSLYAQSDIVNVFQDEIKSLINYRYMCNEQMASKLKALLAQKSIVLFAGEKFKNDDKIEKLIRLLQKNQNDRGLWGWWKKSDEILWISLHVIEALTLAEYYDYQTKLDKGKITELLIWDFENTRYINAKIKILKILKLLDAPINFQPYISHIENTENISLNEYLNVLYLKCQCNMAFNLDSLIKYKNTTMFGNVYYSDEKPNSNMLNNELQNTLLAYKILKTDSTLNEDLLCKIRNYFLEKRNVEGWGNTYESAQIIETILPDILNGKEHAEKPILILNGDINKKVTNFPFELKVSPSQKIEVSKSGDYPVYFTSYQKYLDYNPVSKKGDFEINTSFNGDSITVLKAGQKTILKTNVIVKKDADYVMINIPIPAGCTYSEKNNSFKNESHREYFKQETTIFCEHLTKGEYNFEIPLNTRYVGTYTLNPAKVELMYFPTYNANNEIKTINIE